MMNRTILRAAASLLVALGPFGLLLPAPAGAARLHVSPEGERVAGPSDPGDWSPAGCYADLAAAAAAAAPGDTVLLDRRDHALASAVAIPGTILNRDLDADTTGCRLVLGAAATMSPAAGAPVLEARGFVLEGDGAPSDPAAFVVTGGTVASVTLRNLVFRGLTASDLNARGGTCLTLLGDGARTGVDLVDCIFENNTCRGVGGVVMAQDGWDLRIEGCDFVDNLSLGRTTVAGGRGGALMVNSPTTPTLVTARGTRFLRNSASGPGGAISMDDAGLEMEDCELAESVSAWDLSTTWSAGAGVFMRRNLTHPDSLRLDMRRCLVRDNVGLCDLDPWSGDGGGVMVKGQTARYYTVMVEDCTFQDNYAAQGAGIYIGRYTNGDVVRCRFYRNRAYLQGGATFKGGALIANRGETATYLHCEFIGNQAGLDRDGNDSLELGRGGAFSTRARPRGVFINCSFQDNTAHGPMHSGGAVHKPSEGDWISQENMRIKLINCAFWTGDPLPQITGDTNCYSEVLNCAMRPGDFVSASPDPVGTVELAAMPYVAVDDLHAFTGSPLLDAGVVQPTTVDLDGVVTPVGPVIDIGAYESTAVVSGVPSAGALTALAAFPNPFNPAVTLSFSLERPAAVSLAIHDAAGRRVAVPLAPTRLGAGEHSLVWRGTDAAGRALASGVYLAVLHGAGPGVATKLLLVR